MRKIFFLVFFFIVGWGQASAAVQADTVRVAFFPMRGFHELSPGATEPVGYDVDYMKRIALLARWEVEYVPVEGIEAAFQALKEGRADLVGSVQVSPERVAAYGFSADAVGRTEGALMTLAEKTDLVYEDFSAFNGLRVGMVRNWVRHESFPLYARHNGFSPVIREFEDMARMRAALHAGEIDAMAASIMEMEPDEALLGEFEPAPFFYAMRKDDTRTKEQLDRALAHLRLNEPDFEESLRQKWYPIMRQTPFSKEELDYIKVHPEITMSVLVQRPPFSELREGELRFTGIVPDILRLISAESGIRFVLSPFALGTTPADAVASGRVRAVAGVTRFESQLRDMRVCLTDAFFASQLVMVGRKDSSFSPDLPLTAAVPSGFWAARDFVATDFPNFVIKDMVGPVESALEALRQGRVDLAVNNSLVLRRIMRGPMYDGLHIVPNVSAAESLCIMLPGNVDPVLLSILNKSIRRLEAGDVQRLAAKYYVEEPYSPSFNDFILLYRTEFVGALSLLLLLAASALFVMRRRDKALQVLQENETRLQRIADSVNSGVITSAADTTFCFTHASAGFLRLLGLDAESLKESGDKACTGTMHAEDVFRLSDVLVRADASAGELVEMDVRVLHSDGRTVPVLLMGTVQKDVHGTPLLYCVLCDSTPQYNLKKCLDVERERNRIVAEQSDDILFEYDAVLRSLTCSQKFRKIFGRMPLLGGLEELRLHAEDEERLASMVAETSHTQKTIVARVRILHADGSWLWCRMLLACITQETVLLRLVGRIESIHAEMEKRQWLEALSQRDPLCGLLNRRGFRTAVESCLHKDPEAGDMALFFIDLDNFKAVNEGFGHNQGDTVLQEMAGLLAGHFRSGDLVARYGGDEFCAFAMAMPPAVVRQKAHDLAARLCLTYTEEGLSVTVSASIGVAFYPRDGQCCEDLLQNADKASCEAKARGRGRAVFCDELDEGLF